jgi:amidase
MNDTTREIVMLDALALSRAIRFKEVSCLEIMKAYLDHIEQLNPGVIATVSMRGRGELIAEAKDRDRQQVETTWGGCMAFRRRQKTLKPQLAFVPLWAHRI